MPFQGVDEGHDLVSMDRVVISTVYAVQQIHNVTNLSSIANIYTVATK